MVAAVIVIAAVGGIVIALTRGGGSEPVTTVTPSAPTAPPTDPTPTPTNPSQPPNTPTPAPSTPGGNTPTPPGAVDLGNGVSLTPASGWSVRSKQGPAAQLSNGRELFVGIATQVKPGSNPGQTCDGYHRSVAEQYTNGKFEEPKDVDLKTTKLKAASCLAQVTITNGSGSANVFIFSLVSIRTDGLAVVGSIYFTKESDIAQVNKDFATMVNSMLKGQVAG